MIRRAIASDAPSLLQLMRNLAEFEGYADRFSISEGDLIKRGLAAREDAQFTAWVKDENGALRGYAIVYVIPFTFDLRPTVVLKELFVESAAREQGCGHELFAEVIRYAQSINARLLRWQVLPGNEAAKRFYLRRGGRVEIDWEGWVRDTDVDA